MFWDKAQARKNTTGFIAQLESWLAVGCYWWVSILLPEERFGRLKDGSLVRMRCTICNNERRNLGMLYTIASTLAFQREVLAAIEQSTSQADYDYRLKRIIEQEYTPVVCKRCCPYKEPHDHTENHAFPHTGKALSAMQFVEESH